MPKRGYKKSNHKIGSKLRARHNKHLLIFFISVFIVLSSVTTTFLSFKNAALPCANSISCVSDLSGTYEKDATKGEFLGEVVNVPAPVRVAQMPVLGATAEEKRIMIDLTTQHLYAKEGDRTVMDFLVSTGKWGKTPTGTFTIWIKLRYTRMVGGNKALGTYYNLPNVPYTMYFYNASVPKTMGYGVHGAYWHNNFGHPMSHGCINMREADVAKLFYWADPPKVGVPLGVHETPGTQIVIYGEAPAQ